MRKGNNNKGFTLVELIVVLVILAILAALLVPALLGYIDRAKNQKYIVEARELMEATQVGIVEAYAANKPNYKASTRGTQTGLDIKYAGNYGYITSGWVYTVIQSGSKTADAGTEAKGGVAKAIICNQLVKYIEKANYNLSNNSVPNQLDVDTLNGKQAFMICYSEGGRIIYMQYTNAGMLVTYDGNSFDVKKGGKFIKFRN